jgi:cobalt/nickel transport system permease protein
VQIHFTPPPVTPSPPARLDARWRLASLLALLVAAAAVRSLSAAALALALSLLLAALARVPGRWYLQRLAAIGLFLALFAAPVLLFGDWLDGLRLAGVIVCKSLALFTLACVLLVTAPLETSLKAAHSLYIPGLLVQIALLAYRYLFVLGDELARLRIALRTRGFRNRANLHSWRTVGAASGTLLVRGHDRAERVAAAMRCRGFDGRFRALVAFSTSRADILFFTLSLALAGGLVALDVLWSRA